jgi:hypothetical protein
MAGNRWSRVQEATGNLGDALMRVAMLSADRRYRADTLARQGKLDEMAMRRIDMDEQMLAQSVKRTTEITRQGEVGDARAAAGVLRGQADLGYSPNLGEDGTMAEFRTGLGEGVPQVWDYDPMQSRSFQSKGAANTQALGQAQALADQQTTILGDRAATLGGQGYTVAGQPLETPEPDMITMNGRKFENTPEGQAAALEWREQVEGVGGSNMFSTEVMELMGQGAGRPAEEGDNWFGNKFRGLVEAFGGGGDTPPDAGLMPQGAPPATGLMQQGGGPTLEQQIQQLKDEGWTEEQIQEWLRTQG